jgi:DNA (cytosine-5)-methyltransferase 1
VSRFVAPAYRESGYREKSSLTFGSLFTGIGGLDLGLERAGLRCAWPVEISDYCRQVLARHWPDVPKFADVREVGAHNLPPVDVIAGGFPCQDLSNAGRRAGLEGARSGLWSEFARLIQELKPTYAIIENVAALLQRNHRFDTVLRDLAARGYDAQWSVYSAAQFGAPHLRERVFLVAYPRGVRWRDGDCPPLFSRGLPAQPGPWASDEPVVTFAHSGRAYAGIPSHLRMDDGAAAGLDAAALKAYWRQAAERVKGCGNAVVPQVAEHVGRCLVDFDLSLDMGTDLAAGAGPGVPNCVSTWPVFGLSTGGTCQASNNLKPAKIN